MGDSKRVMWHLHRLPGWKDTQDLRLTCLCPAPALRLTTGECRPWGGGRAHTIPGERQKQGLSA